MTGPAPHGAGPAQLCGYPVRTPHGTTHFTFSGIYLPPVPAPAGSRAFGGVEQEAEQPDGEHDERDPPQDVHGEPEAAEDEREQQHRKDDQHGKLLSCLTAPISAPMAETKRPGR